MMKRGCIAVCVIKCDNCSNNIEYGEQYLIVEERSGIKKLCVNCSLKKKYAKQITEKGEKVITFLDDVESATLKSKEG